MKYLLLLFLSVTVITNSYCNTYAETRDFVNGLRLGVKVAEGSKKALTEEESQKIDKSFQYMRGFLDCRTLSAFFYSYSIEGKSEYSTDTERKSQKKLWGFYTPSLDNYLAAKLIVNAVDTNPKLLTIDTRPEIILASLKSAYSESQ